MQVGPVNPLLLIKPIAGSASHEIIQRVYFCTLMPRLPAAVGVGFAFDKRFNILIVSI